jgi:hypothetical protein
VDIQKCCFSAENVKDHRGVELKAVDERYRKRTERLVSDDFKPPAMDDVLAALTAHDAWPAAPAPDADEEMDDDEEEDDEVSFASTAYLGDSAAATSGVDEDEEIESDEMDVDEFDSGLDLDSCGRAPPAQHRPSTSSSSSVSVAALANVTNSASHRRSSVGSVGSFQARAKRSSSITTPLMPVDQLAAGGPGEGFNAAFSFQDLESAESSPRENINVGRSVARTHGVRTRTHHA